ncbi:MAG: prepilin-type N-terminal cleavage/methylation domain-containing protein [Nitrospiraceae bacterium]|nr:prepilin-type N-terminal cleavage/methylation domain-containing protein [Nitrospiraceae bacterium]
MNTQAERKKGGFTLIEVLLATALTVVLLGAIYSTFFLVAKARDGANDSLVTLYETQKTMDILRREVEAMSGNMMLVDKEYFGKKGSSLSFSAFSPKDGVLSNISYFVKENGNKNTIDLMKQMQEPGGAVENAPLIDDVQEFSVQANSGGKWVGTLQAPNPPDNVRVSLKFLFKGQPFTIEETITPRVGKML